MSIGGRTATWVHSFWLCVHGLSPNHSFHPISFHPSIQPLHHHSRSFNSITSSGINRENTLGENCMYWMDIYLWLFVFAMKYQCPVWRFQFFVVSMLCELLLEVNSWVKCFSTTCACPFDFKKFINSRRVLRFDLVYFLLYFVWSCRQ